MEQLGLLAQAEGCLLWPPPVHLELLATRHVVVKEKMDLDTTWYRMA